MAVTWVLHRLIDRAYHHYMTWWVSSRQRLHYAHCKLLTVLIVSNTDSTQIPHTLTSPMSLTCGMLQATFFIIIKEVEAWFNHHLLLRYPLNYALPSDADPSIECMCRLSNSDITEIYVSRSHTNWVDTTVSCGVFCNENDVYVVYMISSLDLCLLTMALANLSLIG